MRIFKIEAEIEVGADEYAYPVICIEYTYTPGCPATGPSYASGGEPACPPELEVNGATLVKGDGLTPTQEELNAWAVKWMDDDSNYSLAVDEAEDWMRPDPDDQRDQMRDDKLMGFDR